MDLFGSSQEAQIGVRFVPLGSEDVLEVYHRIEQEGVKSATRIGEAFKKGSVVHKKALDEQVDYSAQANQKILADHEKYEKLKAASTKKGTEFVREQIHRLQQETSNIRATMAHEEDAQLKASEARHLRHTNALLQQYRNIERETTGNRTFYEALEKNIFGRGGFLGGIHSLGAAKAGLPSLNMGDWTTTGAGMSGAALTGISVGLTAVAAGMAAVIKIGEPFDEELHKFSALTGAAGKDLDEFKDKAFALSKTFGVDAKEGLESFLYIESNFGTDVLKDKQAVDDMAHSIMTFSQASGEDGSASAKILADAVNQLGFQMVSPAQKAQEMTRIMNVMAAGAREGAAFMPDLSSSLEVTGSVATHAKVPVEQLVAVLEALSKAGIKGAEAGTNFRDILLRMEAATPRTAKVLETLGISFYDISPQRVGLIQGLTTLKEHLEKLHDPVKEATVLNRLFGAESVNAAQTLLDSIPIVEEYTKRVTDTNTAADEAATRTDTLAHKFDIFKENVLSAADSLFEKMKPALSATLDVANNVASKIGEINDKETQQYNIQAQLLRQQYASSLFLKSQHGDQFSDILLKNGHEQSKLGLPSLRNLQLGFTRPMQPLTTEDLVAMGLKNDVGDSNKPDASAKDPGTAGKQRLEEAVDALHDRFSTEKAEIIDHNIDIRATTRQERESELTQALVQTGEKLKLDQKYHVKKIGADRESYANALKALVDFHTQEQQEDDKADEAMAKKQRDQNAKNYTHDIDQKVKGWKDELAAQDRYYSLAIGLTADKEQQRIDEEKLKLVKELEGFEGTLDEKALLIELYYKKIGAIHQEYTDKAEKDAQKEVEPFITAFKGGFDKIEEAWFKPIEKAFNAEKSLAGSVAASVAQSLAKAGIAKLTDALFNSGKDKEKADKGGSDTVNAKLDAILKKFGVIPSMSEGGLVEVHDHEVIKKDIDLAEIISAGVETGIHKGSEELIKETLKGVGVHSAEGAVEVAGSGAMLMTNPTAIGLDSFDKQRIAVRKAFIDAELAAGVSQDNAEENYKYIFGDRGAGVSSANNTLTTALVANTKATLSNTKSTESVAQKFKDVGMNTAKSLLGDIPGFGGIASGLFDNLIPHADGGIAMKPIFTTHTHMAGEHPEAILPLHQLPQVMNMMGMGGNMEMLAMLTQIHAAIKQGPPATVLDPYGTVLSQQSALNNNLVRKR